MSNWIDGLAVLLVLFAGLAFGSGRVREGFTILFFTVLMVWCRDKLRRTQTEQAQWKGD